MDPLSLYVFVDNGVCSEGGLTNVFPFVHFADKRHIMHNQNAQSASMAMEMEERVPSSSPSESMKPSKSLEPTVMRLETNLPSSISTNELV
eukprot:scaffold7522_cov202-Skeletonema_marinoi.AAC.20